MIAFHPRAPRRKVDRDFVLMLHEWKIEPGARRPDPNAMDGFNLLTMNGRAFPGTEPLVLKAGASTTAQVGVQRVPIEHVGHRGLGRDVREVLVRVQARIDAILRDVPEVVVARGERGGPALVPAQPGLGDSRRTRSRPPACWRGRWCRGCRRG